MKVTLVPTKTTLISLLCAGSMLLPCAHAQQGDADIQQLTVLRAKAERGDAQSQFKLGEAFYAGKFGVATNYVEAVKWFQQAADQNHAKAQCNLGLCYAYGEGVAKDEAAAVRWFRKAAEHNLAKAQCDLGNCYANGQGVATNYAEAVKWYHKAAAQNYARAQFNLSICYAHGKGVAKDEAEAVKWYRKAAEQGNDKIQQQYASNLLSLQRPDAGPEAARWFSRSAEQGNTTAQFRLGLLLYEGKLVPSDKIAAYKWITLAAENGSKEAKNLLREMELFLNQSELAEARKQAAEFKPARVGTTKP